MNTELLPIIRNLGAHGVPRPTEGRAGSPLPAARRARSDAPYLDAAHAVTRPAWAFLLLLCALCLATTFTAWAAPTVTGVSASQGGAAYVDIGYYLAETNSDITSVNVYVLVSSDSGTNWTVPATSFAGDNGLGVPVSSTAQWMYVQWTAFTDWPGHYSTNCRVRVIACDNGMVLVPAGSYNQGDNLDSESDAPVHSVFVNPFLMDNNLVTGSLWTNVQAFASTHGYTFDHTGSAKGANYPVETINWYDTMKWCNARSELEGVTPVYYTNATTMDPSSVYKFGDVDLVFMKTNAYGTVVNGYRLPTEAEWEKAARGGLSGHRFPWGDTISESQANYGSNPGSPAYDVATTTGYNPLALALGGGQPWTSPVGSFPPNEYGLYDMAGNVGEWCWDWYNSGYYASGLRNPQGPPSGSYRVLRGGNWNYDASYPRCASRYGVIAPSTANYEFGFRCVRGF